MDLPRDLGHYRLTAHLGSGGMGDVYRATDTRLKRDVALKILPTDFANDATRLARFRREAEAVASLNHPNVVTVHAVEEIGGTHLLAMELVEGRTLDDLLPPDGLPLDDLLAIAQPLAEALEAAHVAGIVHRDLKPGNVMRTPEGRLKVLDFGLARTLSRATEDAETRTLDLSPLTGAGTVLGTVPYMAPEQLRSEPAEPRTDLFSLGVLLYELATGRRPFPGATSTEIGSAILRDDPAPLGEERPEYPDELVRLVHRCLEKASGDRPRDAREVVEALREIREALVAPGSAAGPDLASVAVLPFADLSPEKDQDYFCDGMAEEILNLLAKVSDLRVSSRTSTLRYRNSATDSRTIGRDLGVGTLVEGSVRKAGDRLRITAQLIDTATDSHLWSDRYDRTLDDVFAIQEDIAEHIVTALKVTLAPEESAALRAAPTGSAEAYDFCLRGRTFFRRDTREDIERAREMFRQAIAIDPDYTQAHAGLADATAFLHKHFEQRPELLDEAEAAAARALEIDPDSAEAHTSRGVIHWLKAEHEAAGRQFETAVRLDSTLYETRYLMGQWCLTRGDFEGAVRNFGVAAKLLPEDYQAPLLQASSLAALGRDEESRRAHAEGADRARRHLQGQPDDARAWYLGAGAFLALGDTATALRWAEKAHAIDGGNPMVLFNLAGIYAGAERVDEAIDFTEEAVRRGFRYKPAYENAPDLDPLRSHPRFRTLLDSLD
jgi:serine/threonine protein kinase/tetratricopeptide (TPR) repeat protein